MADLELSVSLFGMAEHLVRRRRVLLAGVAVGIVAFEAIAIFRPAYRAEAAFAPTPAAGSASSTGSLAGLAEQLGFNLNAVTGGQPLEFYSRLVTSRALLAQVATTAYAFPRKIDALGAGLDTMHTTLLELYAPSGDTPDERVLHAVKILESKVATDLDGRSNVVTVTVRARWPGLAVAMTRRVLDLVNEFNLHSLQSQARSEREFVETRLQDAQSELAAAEDSLQQFLERNRTYQSSPRLQFQAARLQRRVDLRQQVYTTLAQEYEQARIAEVRNTPVITVFSPPEGSAKRVRAPLVMGLVGAILGVLTALVWIAIRAFLERETHTNPVEFEGFRTAVGELRGGGRGKVGTPAGG